MKKQIQDYLISVEDIDWPSVLANWSWLLPSTVSVWLVNRFADLFMVTQSGAVYMLDVAAGSFSKLAETKDDFLAQAADSEKADYWFLIPMVDELVSRGIRLDKGQCYGWKLPPTLGGQYTLDNCGTLSLCDYLGGYGSIHRQLQDVPVGAQVILKVNEPEKHPGE